METNKISIGKKIEELRKRTNVTQEELAEVLDVSRQAVSQWELDTAIPKADKLKSLCEYFNVRPEYLLFDDAEMKPLVSNEEIAVAKEVKPKKKSRIKRALIISTIIIALLASAFMLFVAWLKTPSKGVAYSASISAWNFDIVTILQILAGVIIFIVVCVVISLIVKYIRNRKK